MRDNNKCKDCCDKVIDDCFYKIYDKNIMAYTETMESARKNEILLIDLSLEQRIVVGDSLKEIMNYNTDFTQLTMNFFSI